MAIFSTKQDEQSLAEIERLSNENARLSRENERLNLRMKSLEQDVVNAETRRQDEAQKFAAEKREYERKRKALEQAYNRVKMQRDKLRIGNKTDPL